MLDKKTMRNAISVFQRFQIVETLDKDLGREDSRVIIFDSALILEENGVGRLTGYGSVISECKCKTVYQYGTGKVHMCSHYSELKKIFNFHYKRMYEILEPCGKCNKGVKMNKNIVKIAVGLLMIVVVLIGYIPQPEYLVELTCVSNTLGGLLLLADGILNITKKKNFPNSFYLNVAVSILMVFLVCMGSLTGAYKFNFKGAFFFMHVINPIAFLVCYMLFVNERGRKIRFVLTAPIMVMVYFLFDYIRCQFTGEFVYGFVEAGELTFFYAIIVGIVMYIFSYLLALGLFSLNRLVHRKGN